MDYLIICATALAVSGVTLLSGFGLGTVLLPAFALFFPLPVAIAATAVVHLANNLFKLFLVGRAANWRVVLRFGLPAALAALVGAATLAGVAELGALLTYEWLGRPFVVTPVKLIIGLVIVAFAALEIQPAFAALTFPAHWLPLGGLLSGFFGGLSGHQGAFRSAFLLKAGLDKRAFVATGVVVAVIVDTMRLAVYGASAVLAPLALPSDRLPGLVFAATLAAFLGTVLGTRLLDKITLRGVQLTVATCMIAVGSGLAAGWL